MVFYNGSIHPVEVAIRGVFDTQGGDVIAEYLKMGVQRQHELNEHAFIQGYDDAGAEEEEDLVPVDYSGPRAYSEGNRVPSSHYLYRACGNLHIAHVEGDVLGFDPGCHGPGGSAEVVNGVGEDAEEVGPPGDPPVDLASLLLLVRWDTGEKISSDDVEEPRVSPGVVEEGSLLVVALEAAEGVHRDDGGLLEVEGDVERAQDLTDGEGYAEEHREEYLNLEPTVGPACGTVPVDHLPLSEVLEVPHAEPVDEVRLDQRKHRSA